MDKVAKLVLILDVFLMIIYFFSKYYLDISSLYESVFLSFLVGITFFVILVLLFSLIKRFLDKKKKKNEIKSSIVIYVISILLSLIVIFVSFNSSLYIQALLGNDLFLSLDVEEDIFSVTNGESFSINSDFKIITNPFCSSSCEIILTDLSSNKILSKEELNFSISTIISRDYEIFIDEDYSGQKIYRINFECKTKDTNFCYVPTNKTKYSSKLIILNHSLNEEQLENIDSLRSQILSLMKENAQLVKNVEEINFLISNSSILDLSYLSNRSNDLLFSLKEENFNRSIYYFSSQQFSNLNKELILQSNFIRSSKDKFSSLNSSIYKDIEEYNELAKSISSIHFEIIDYFSLYLDNSSINSLSNFVDIYNEVSFSFNNYSTVSKKKSLFQKLISSKDSLVLIEYTENSSKLEKQLNNFSLSLISFNYSIANFSFELSNPSSVCCIFGSCNLCLENSSSINYPVILLHGHSFNERVSAFASLDLFNEFQIQLEKEGYLNAGSFFYSDYNEDSKGVLGKINNSISIKVSYYFDVLSSDEGFSLLETKADNIDTYAIRLKDVIENVKYLTGKDKVIIVAHSMGGLVARRYVQVFGENSVDKLILVTVPNYGVDGFVIDYCSLFGTEDECTDMSEDSLFLNKLNRGDSPSIAIENFVGEGCSWEDSFGDGVVKNDSAYLLGANNIYINGTCDGFTYFHNEVLDIDKYPEVYNLIKDSLK